MNISAVLLFLLARVCAESLEGPTGKTRGLHQTLWLPNHSKTDTSRSPAGKFLALHTTRERKEIRILWRSFYWFSFCFFNTGLYGAYGHYSSWFSSGNQVKSMTFLAVWMWLNGDWDCHQPISFLFSVEKKEGLEQHEDEMRKWQNIYILVNLIKTKQRKRQKCEICGLLNRLSWHQVNWYPSTNYYYTNLFMHSWIHGWSRLNLVFWLRLCKYENMKRYALRICFCQTPVYCLNI